MHFQWDDHKELLNIKKHGIDFSTAALVFCDNDRIEMYDNKHSGFEDRFVTIGEISLCKSVITVIYTIRQDDIYRIICARKATREEKEEYYGKY